MSKQGLFHKFNVSRTDGTDAPGGKHFGDEYFVMSITADKHSIPAIAAYAESCAADYPALAADLRTKIADTVKAASLFIAVPEVMLPGGLVVPPFQVMQYSASRGPAGIPQSVADAMPWVEVSFNEAMKACADAGYDPLFETRALAIAFDISQQDINWTGGKVGEGKIFQGIHKGNVSEAQAGNYESSDPEERSWHQLSNGERIYHFAGNCFSWAFDDVQGSADGLTGKIAADSISLTTAPYPSEEKGMGWRPDGERNWSGYALIRGGCWYGSDAGAFNLRGGYPENRSGYVGFRCTTKGL